MRVGGDAAAAWSGDQGMRATVSYDCLHTSHILMQAARTSSTLHEHVPCISRELLTAPCPRREVALYTVPSFVLRGELKWSKARLA